VIVRSLVGPLDASLLITVPSLGFGSPRQVSTRLTVSGP
jgi:hypothetical protein